jgi:hypothetical protein
MHDQAGCDGERRQRQCRQAGLEADKQEQAADEFKQRRRPGKEQRRWKAECSQPAKLAGPPVSLPKPATMKITASRMRPIRRAGA